MYNPALEEWLNEAQGDPAMNPGGNPPAEGLGVPPGAGGVQAPDPNAPVMAADPSGGQVGQDAEKQSDQEIPDRSEDPQAPDMPEEKKKQSFEQWQDTFFRESVKADVNKLIDLIQQVRDLDLESYPRKFIEDNLQVLFLRQNANIDKASKEVRKQIKAQLDSNFPARSIVGYLQAAMQTMPELNNVFIKIKGLLGSKGDMHRKYVASLLGATQVGNGGNTEDIIYNEKDYSIRISTRFNDKWGRVEIGKWALKEEDPEKYLTEPEMKRLEEGSPEERDVLRRRIVMESIADNFKKRAFIIHVVGTDGTVYMVGWDLGGSLRNAYTEGKLVVKTILSQNSEALINDQGQIVPAVDLKVMFVKETGELDKDGKPVREENDFLERIDGILYLTASQQIIKEASSSFSGISWQETPYTGNPNDLKVLMRCVPNAPEMLMRQC
jgi:hypothetical protein